MTTVSEAADNEARKPKDIYSPELERTDVNEALIDDENFEVGLMFGIVNIEDFGSSELYGLKFTYHINQDFFVNLTGGIAKAGLSTVEEVLPNPILTDKQRQFEYYDFTVGWNLLPGEAFITDTTALNTSFYLVAGVGNTEFAGNSEFTYVVGAGYKILYNDWLAINIDTRDRMFNTEILTVNKRSHNVELALGVSFFF